LAIDSRRQNKIELQSPEQSIFATHCAVQHHPHDKLEQVRTRQSRNAVPENCAPFGIPSRGSGILKRQPFDPFGIQMDFAVVVARQPLEQFRQRAFGAVAPIDKRRDDCQSQFSESRGLLAGRLCDFQLRPEKLQWKRIARTARVWEAGTGYPPRSRRKRSKRNLHTLATPQT
jgi:hypothetical protein